ncbi:hypothetical protein ACU4GD_39645 [Cupriavidus basilensis]
MIQNPAQLQGINDNLGGYYVLGNKISGGSLKSIGGDYSVLRRLRRPGQHLEQSLGDQHRAFVRPVSHRPAASATFLGLAHVVDNEAANAGAAAGAASVRAPAPSPHASTGGTPHSTSTHRAGQGGLVGRTSSTAPRPAPSVSLSSSCSAAAA